MAGTSVAVGQQAPDFTLPDGNGNPVRLHDLLGERAVVLYFYPKDETSGCTTEACSFRDSYDVFKEAGAEVVGVSSDSVESHRKFADHHSLPFLLLSDQGGAVRKQFGATGLFGLMPGRVTFVIDKAGTVRHVFSSLLDANRHIREALHTLQAEAPSAGSADR
ncbi:MAG: peroxiredoxin [Candidatus Dormiibacterota bacterium]